jgi:hypothetical protein
MTVRESNTKPYLESFRNFLKEREITSSSSRVYQIEAILVIGKEHKRNKADILSDIRAIEAVTIVSVIDHADRGGKNYSDIKIKIDTSPISSYSVPRILLGIKRQVQRIRGVDRFEYKSRPEQI